MFYALQYKSMIPRLEIKRRRYCAASALGFALSMMMAANFLMSAHAQIPHAPATPAPPADAPESAASMPRYSASQLKQAFNFMDSNHDEKISREEASGFRGVAKNFDRADTNHDNALSRKEFDKAMNYVKPQ